MLKDGMYARARSAFRHFLPWKALLALACIPSFNILGCIPHASHLSAVEATYIKTHKSSQPVA